MLGDTFFDKLKSPKDFFDKLSAAVGLRQRRLFLADGRIKPILLELEKFLIASLQCKSAGFSEEQEWRMFLPMRAIKDPELMNGSRRPSEKLLLTKSIDFMRPRLRFNTTQGSISPYLEISLDEISESPVKEWWLDPENRHGDFDMTFGTRNAPDVTGEKTACCAGETTCAGVVETDERIQYY